MLFCISVLSCEDTQPGSAADLSADPKNVIIGAEVSLINLSQEAKSHRWTFGDDQTFTKTGDAPTQAVQIQEKSFVACPATANPRFLLHGSIRIKTSNRMRNNNNYGLPSVRSFEIKPEPEKISQ